jgi:phage terminase large subunit GpA-like protein
MVGVNAGKSAIMSALNLSSHGPLYCHFPSEGKGYDLEYFKGLKSEVFKHEYKNGQTSAKWVKIYERNEPLDCRNYAMLAREILKPPYADLQNLRNEGKQAYVIKEQPAVNQNIRRRRLGKGVTV